MKQGDSLSTILFNLALQKVIQSIKMVPNGVKIGKEQWNILAYADDIVLIGKNEIEIRQFMIVEWKNSSKQDKTRQLTIKNYTFERDENFKYLGVILNENEHQVGLQERIKNANKTLHATEIF